MNCRQLISFICTTKCGIMNAALKVLLVVSVIAICSSFPQQGNAPPARPYRDTTSEQVNPPGSLEGPQVPEEFLRSTKDIPKGSDDAPKRVARQTKDVPKDQPAAGTKDIPKLTQQSRVARQAQPIPQPLPDPIPPQTRPGSAGQPQVQPIRQSRQTKDIPKVEAAAGTKDIPKEDTRPKRQVAQPIPQPLPGSAGQPQTLPPRQTRQTKDIPKDSLEHDQPLAGQHTKDIPKKQD